MLGHPSFRAGLVRRDAEGVALLAEQRVAPVAGAHAPDQPLLRKMHDEAAVGREVAERVQAPDEVVAVAHVLQRHRSHARHDVHAGHHVGAVGDHHPDAAHRRAGGPHEVGDHPHRAAAHAAAEQPLEPLLALRGSHPVVGGPGLLARWRADEGELLGARHVGGVAAMQVAVRVGPRVQGEQGAVPHHVVDQAVVLRLRPVGPGDLRRAGQRGDLIHPLLDLTRETHG